MSLSVTANLTKPSHPQLLTVARLMKVSKKLIIVGN